MRSKITKTSLKAMCFVGPRAICNGQARTGSSRITRCSSRRRETRYDARHGEDAGTIPQIPGCQGTLLTTAVLRQDPLSCWTPCGRSALLPGSRRDQTNAGESTLGAFHYIPMLCYEGRHIRREQRFVLTLLWPISLRLQGRMPDSGIIWHGQACQATKVRLPPDLRRAERCLRAVQEMARR